MVMPVYSNIQDMCALFRWSATVASVVCVVNAIGGAGCAKSRAPGPGVAPAVSGPISATIEDAEVRDNVFLCSLKLTSGKPAQLDVEAFLFLNTSGYYFIGAGGCFQLADRPFDGTVKPATSGANLTALVPGEPLRVPIEVPLSGELVHLVDETTGKECISLPEGEYSVVLDVDFFQCLFAKSPSGLAAIDARCRAEGSLKVR